MSHALLQRNRFLLVSAVIGLLAVMSLTLYYRELAMRHLLVHETRANEALTAVFGNSLGDSYRALLAASTQVTASQTGTLPQVARMDREVRALMHGSRVAKVKLYRLDGLTVYSSDPTQIGDDKSANEGFLGARAGDPVSQITFRDQFDALEGLFSDRNLVASYLPLYEGDLIVAVLEVYSDVTELVGDIEHTRRLVTLVSLGAILFIYLLLLVAARRADVTERRRVREGAVAAEALRERTYVDPTTGLSNRLCFGERLDELIERGQREAHGMVLVSIALDRFKLINESFGHAAGDEVLRVAAKRLRAHAAGDGMVFRTGGAEFGVLLPRDLETDSALDSARRLVSTLCEPMLIADHLVNLSASAGVSRFPHDAFDAAALVRSAGAALQLAKQHGGGDCRVYTPELDAGARDRLELETALRQALARDEFVLHYQPRVSGDGTRAHCFEALLRWNRDGRLVPPCDFIPVLEQTGLIGAVGEWVLAEACRQACAWEAQSGVAARVSVNVSARQFTAEGFVDCVAETLEETGLAPGRLELELTETVLLEDTGAAIDTMHAIKALGALIAIDDFGAGYSSFNYLRMLPVDYLKIDRCFVMNIASQPRDLAIVRAIAALARSLDLGLVAEGVEDAEQAALLAELHCDELQGFHFARPAEPAAVAHWLNGATDPSTSTSVA